jgi:hypothetical protein
VCRDQLHIVPLPDNGVEFAIIGLRIDSPEASATDIGQP